MVDEEFDFLGKTTAARGQGEHKVMTRKIVDEEEAKATN
jgi:hypothetical protein